MYPKSKSPLETKYERLRGMCGGAGGTCGIFRLTTVYSSMAGHGGIWLVLCVYQYTDSAAGKHGIPSVQGRHSRKEARYTNATRDIIVYDIRTQYTTAITSITRASQRPGACIAYACVRACVILLYYYIIIILLYYYIIIFIYTQYIQYTQYTQYIQQW